MSSTASSTTPNSVVDPIYKFRRDTPKSSSCKMSGNMVYYNRSKGEAPNSLAYFGRFYGKKNLPKIKKRS